MDYARLNRQRKPEPVANWFDNDLNLEELKAQLAVHEQMCHQLRSLIDHMEIAEEKERKKERNQRNSVSVQTNSDITGASTPSNAPSSTQKEGELATPIFNCPRFFDAEEAIKIIKELPENSQCSTIDMLFQPKHGDVYVVLMSKGVTVQDVTMCDNQIWKSAGGKLKRNPDTKYRLYFARNQAYQYYIGLPGSLKKQLKLKMPRKHDPSWKKRTFELLPHAIKTTDLKQKVMLVQYLGDEKCFVERIKINNDNRTQHTPESQDVANHPHEQQQEAEEARGRRLRRLRRMRRQEHQQAEQQAEQQDEQAEDEQAEQAEAEQAEQAEQQAEQQGEQPDERHRHFKKKWAMESQQNKRKLSSGKIVFMVC